MQIHAITVVGRVANTRAGGAGTRNVKVGDTILTFSRFAQYWVGDLPDEILSDAEGPQAGLVVREVEAHVAGPGATIHRIVDDETTDDLPMVQPLAFDFLEALVATEAAEEAAAKRAAEEAAAKKAAEEAAAQKAAAKPPEDPEMKPERIQGESTAPKKTARKTPPKK